MAVRRVAGGWEAVLEGEAAGQVRARAVVNAAGPWVQMFLDHSVKAPTKSRVRLVKGSHIVVPKLYAGGHPYILQNTDKRIVFVIPYEGDFSLIGTTDLAYDGDPAEVTITPEEVDYLCGVVNRYFARQIGAGDVAWSYSGVRPLYDDASADVSAVTRDYVFDVDAPEGGAPLLSIFGGKLTTYRRLAEHALGKLLPLMGVTAGAWTGKAPLPGGDLPDADFDAFVADLRRVYPWLPDKLLVRWAHAYGTRVDRLLKGAQGTNDLGPHLGADLYARELEHLVREEWARTADDVLWRRTKLGLHLDEAGRARVASWLAGTRA